MKAIDLTSLLTGLEGQWVAFNDDYSKVISHDKILQEVITKAKEKGHPNPILFYVSTDCFI